MPHDHSQDSSSLAHPQQNQSARDHSGVSAYFEKMIARHSIDSIFFTDPDGVTVWANDVFVQRSGYTHEELIGQKPRVFLQGPQTDPETIANISESMRNKRTMRAEIVNYTKLGDAYWVDLTLVPCFNDEGKHTHFMSIERDITDQKSLAFQTEVSLAYERERRRERKILSQMSEWLFSAQTMRELNQVVSKSMAQLFPGTSGDMFVYSSSRDMLDNVSHWGFCEAQAHLHANECWGLRRGRAYAYGTSDINFSCEHAETDEHSHYCLPIVAHGDTIGLLTIQFPSFRVQGSDPETLKKEMSTSWELAMLCAEQISLAAANVRLQTELQDKSVKDALTGLWNRRWFNDTATRKLKKAMKDGSPMSLIAIDVDHFKKFNDTYGHDAGDSVLQSLSGLLCEHFVDNWHPCRIGGEEFAVICTSADQKTARTAIDAMRPKLAELEIRNGSQVLPAVTISAGITQARANDTLERMTKRADDALYEAKASGRNRSIVFGQNSTSKVTRVQKNTAA